MNGPRWPRAPTSPVQAFWARTGVKPVLVGVMALKFGGSTERVRLAKTWFPAPSCQSRPMRGETQL